MTTETGVCTTTATVDKQTHPLAIGGDPGTTYDVELRVRGVVEWMTYSGCAASTQAPFCIGGTKLDATFNIYSLSVPDPKQTYYFNWGATIEHAVYTVDYTVTIPMKGKAALTFSVDGQNLKEMANITNLVVPGIPPAPAGLCRPVLAIRRRVRHGKVARTSAIRPPAIVVAPRLDSSGHGRARD
jgi:hypothetical protein